MALTSEAIVAAASRILDEYGLGDLSMRRVAEALDVQAGALYYHVPNKQSLLAAVADEILGSMAQPSSLQDWALEYRRALLSHRDGAELVASSLAMGLGTIDPKDHARLLPGGGDDVVRTLEHLVLGASLQDQTRAQLAQLGLVEAFDRAEAERTFRQGVDTLLRGAGIIIESVA